MICEACHGEGLVWAVAYSAVNRAPCRECNGSGIVSCCDTAGSTEPLTTRTPDNNCLNCGKVLTAASSFEAPRQGPEPGDIAICISCAHLHCYTSDLRLRQPTDEEIVEIAGDPEIVRMMKALGHLQRVEASYRDARRDERACDHCGKLYRGPAVYCSLKCAQADA